MHWSVLQVLIALFQINSLTLDQWIHFDSHARQWPAATVCNATMQSYRLGSATQMSGVERDQVAFCWTGAVWARCVAESALADGGEECDRLIRLHNGSLLHSLERATRDKLVECGEVLLCCGAREHGMVPAWVSCTPQAQPVWRHLLVAESLRGLLAVVQYASDRRVATTTRDSDEYRGVWRRLGLSVAHYNAAPDDATPQEYFEQNDVAAAVTLLWLRSADATRGYDDLLWRSTRAESLFFLNAFSHLQ
jgi:hypothetical protein